MMTNLNRDGMMILIPVLREYGIENPTKATVEEIARVLGNRETARQFVALVEKERDRNTTVEIAK